jgi:hypothetical protein
VEEVHFLSKKAQTLNITSSNAQVKKNLLPFWACKTVCNKQSIASKPRHGRDMKAGRSNLQALGTKLTNGVYHMEFTHLGKKVLSENSPNLL